MQELDFELKEDYIELIRLLKYLGIAESGLAAKQLVSDGRVFLNATKESRFRAKLRKHDVVKVNNCIIKIR